MRTPTRQLRIRLSIVVIVMSVACSAHAEDLQTRMRSWERAAIEAYGRGDHAEAIVQWDSLLTQASLEALLPERAASALYNRACSQALAGRLDDALASLERAVDLGWSDPSHLRRDPDLDSLRSGPRFDALLERMQASADADRSFWNPEAFRTPYRENISDDEKLAGLARVWAEVKYNFAYFDQVPDLDWDALYVQTIPRVLATPSTRDYYLELGRMIARLHDGHTNVMVPREVLAQVYSRPDLRTQQLSDDVIVMEVGDSGLREQGIVEGLRVVAIEGQPTQAYAKESVLPWVTASTPQDVRNRTYGFDLLRGSENVPAHVTFEDVDGRRFDTALERRLRWPSMHPSVEWETLDGDVGLLRIHTFSGNAPVDSLVAVAMNELGDRRALIIDIRDNGGGTSGWWVMRYLVDDYQTSPWRTRQYRATYRAWGREQSWFRQNGAMQAGLSADRRFDGPVALLTSARTFSAAEDLAWAFAVSGRGPIVGQPTGGSTGQPLLFDIPGGGRARVCTKRDTWPDGSDWVGTGIGVDVEAWPTREDVVAGRDAVIARAVEVLLARGD